MTVLVRDIAFAAQLRAEREATDGSKHDEVWEGVYVVSPLPDFLHQILATRLAAILDAMLEASGEGLAVNGVNVSDREEGWTHNYREPDVAVILKDSPGKDCENHWCGGPDFLVEILSPNDSAREKREFYAKVGVREMLIVDRDPWALELYRLDAGQLALVGTSIADLNDVLASAVLPLTFRLVPGEGRPQIEVSRIDGAQTWRI